MNATANIRPRLAIVQHGDYPSAYQTFIADDPESYAGMKKTVGALEDLMAGTEFLLISLDGGFYCSAHQSGTLIGLPPHQLPRFIPRRFAAAWQRRRVLAEIRRFKPTHLLIRTCGQLANELLEYGSSENIQCQVIFANVFDPQRRNDTSTRQLIGLLNQPFVQRVANHLQPAVDSMLECGLSPQKAVAYDVDLPEQTMMPEAKSFKRGEQCRLVFAGSLLFSKGCEDVLLATVELRRRGVPACLSIYGDGHHRRRLTQIATPLPAGMITFHGRQPNELIVRAMRDSTFVCVTSHREFPEGMPLTLKEALGTRSPVIASNHPVFVRAFQAGEGLRFVEEKQPQRIADAVEQLWSDPAEYRRLSETTTQALDRVSCRTKLSSLLKDWAQTFKADQPTN